MAETTGVMVKIMDIIKTLYKLVKQLHNVDQKTLAPRSGSLMYRTAVTFSEIKDMAMLKTPNHAEAQFKDGAPRYVWK